MSTEGLLAVGIHHQNWLKERDRLDAELLSLEEKAGVRARHAAFVDHQGDSDLQKLYFSVSDKDLRKELIAQARRRRKFGSEFTKALLADAKDELAAIEDPGFRVPWAIPALLACAVVWVGYSLWSNTGTLAGAVAGFFVGSAYISWKKSSWRLAVAQAKREVQNQEAELKRDYFSEPFSETEEMSGGEDEGAQPEPTIHWYARMGNIAGIKREIKMGVSVEVENNESWGSRPLHRAAANGNVDAIKILVSEGADVGVKNKLHGWLPIHYASRRGCAECIRVLLEAGSPVDTRDNYDDEPIHRAAEGGDPESIKILLDAGARVDAIGGPHQNQPIHAAAWAGHYLAVETLLVRGADPNAENAHGARPLYFASLENHSEHQRTMGVLMAAGAKPRESERSA